LENKGENGDRKPENGKKCGRQFLTGYKYSGKLKRDVVVLNFKPEL